MNSRKEKNMIGENDPTKELQNTKDLADNPIQMATRIKQLEKQAREWKIGTDPSRKALLIQNLKACISKSETDAEAGHGEADDLLLEYINDEEISDCYGQIKKWYS